MPSRIELADVLALEVLDEEPIYEWTTRARPFRAAVKVGLLRAGVPEVIADHYIGHSTGPTQRAYVPEHAPETSPYWDALIVAVNTIPPHP